MNTGSKSSSSGTKTNSSGQKLYSDGYGGWTTTPSTSKEYAQTYGGSGKTQTSGGSSSTRPSSGGTSASGSSGSSAASRPVSGGSSYSSGGNTLSRGKAESMGYTTPSNSGGGSSLAGSSVQYSGTPSGTAAANSTNYHQEAINAAARGDWAAVAKALAARQAKINAQGGNDRGTSNAAILASLQKQYADSYNALSASNRNTISGMATGNINGMPTNPLGWDDGRDYFADAKQYAQSGQLDAAYDALLRRGFKMYDTGSTGGGTTQDQAYALIRQLYSQSGMARQEYNDQIARNAQRLAEHPTQFGTGSNPALANKHFVSADGQYIIYYDSTGTPTAAKPNNGDTYSRQYSPQEIELMRQYYSGADGVDFADIQRQIHNNNVVYTGNGRLVDQYGNYASGTPVGLTDMYNWDPTTIPGTQNNVRQDAAALQDILNRINAGESFGTLGGGAGTPVTVPVTRPVTTPVVTQPVTQPSGGYSGYGGTGTGTLAGLGEDGLADLLRQMYTANLDAQLAGLRSTYEQDYAGIRAQDDLISRLYANQRNQAAVQNDIQRMQMAEFGAMRGLNTGASGQMALAQSASYQNALGELGAAESQSLADNALNLEKLSAGYRSSIDQAKAANNADLAQALYSEYVRQINAAQQAQAAALAQSNWERQFAYSQQQDALSQANWERQFLYGQQQDALSQNNWERQFLYGQNQDALSQNNWERQYAYGLAGDLMQYGVVPDASTLAAAGIPQGSAQALAEAYQREIAAQLALKQAQTAKASSSGSSSGGSRSSGSSSASSSKPKLTYAQAKAAAEDGLATQEVINAINYYGGAGAYEQLYGNANSNTMPRETPVQSGQAMNPDYYRAFGQSVQAQLNSGKTDAAIRNVESQWPKLSDQQRNGIQNILKKYGYSYKP